VQDGQPAATIVCHNEAAEGGRRPFSTKNAADTLQEWVKLMSGAELPIARQAPAQGAHIYIGQAASLAGLKLADIKSPSNEGLRARCDGKHVYIAGQTTVATYRAVARFLEREFGCRWFADRDWARVYPTRKTLKVLKGEFTETPGFLYRRIWGAEGAFRNAQWNTWNGHGGVGIPMGHSWGFLTKKDFEDHPDWFRMDENGKRVYGHWPNLGNPGLRKRFIQWALEASKDGTASISLSPPDDHRVDYSPEAQKYDDPNSIEPSSGRVSMTNRFMGIANEVAWKIYKRGKKARIGFYAYSDYTLPPTDPKLSKLCPNICIWVAPIRFSRYHPIGHPYSSSRQLLKQIIDGWSERASMLGYRTYNFNLAEVMTPYSKITTWSHDLPYLHGKGCVGISLESFNTWEINGPHLYLSIRLSYDPRLDPWEIMADYWDKFYGPAAEHMESYWMEVDSAFVNLRSQSGSIHALPHVYTPERLQKLKALLDQASAAVKGRPAYEYRVNLARRGLERAFFYRKWYDSISRGDLKAAGETLKNWYAYVQESIKLGHTNVKYSKSYISRFVGKNTWRAWGAVFPKNAPPNRIIAVLPDEWKYSTQDDIEESGIKGDPYDVALDGSKWRTVKTYTNTLNGQGFPEYFGSMWYRLTHKAPKSSPKLSMFFVKADRKVTLYINGKQVNETEQEAFYGTEIDVTGHLRPGKENQITVQVRHIPLPELFLGGIVQPVYLIEKAK